MEKLKIDKLSSPGLKFEDVEIQFGKVEEYWEESVGPTPKPTMAELRSWDFKLLNRYEPFYSPLCDMCCLCTNGVCDLTKGKKGACGIKIDTQQARMNTLIASVGTAAHATHARDLVEHLIKKLGRDYPIELGTNIAVEAPLIRTIVGIKPKTLGDLEEVLDYADRQQTKVLATTATGQEASPKDFESKQLHIGMIDNLVMEVAELAQIVGYGFPKGDPDAPLVEIGLGAVDKTKPVIMCVGHNVIPGAEIINYLEEKGLQDRVEVCGLCCTAHDLARRSPSAKVVGPISEQMRFIKSGVPDVIVVDVQCVRTDLLEEAIKIKAPLIATNDEICIALKDRTNDPADKIVSDLVIGKEPGVLILDPVKVGEVAVRVAEALAPKRAALKALPNIEALVEKAKECSYCNTCSRVCPANLKIADAVYAVKKGNLQQLSELRELCWGCAKCEAACPKEIPVIQLMEKAAEKKIKEEKYKLRSGRGPVLDTEIRHVGPPIVLGEIPGVVAFAGCTNYVKGAKEIAEMAEEFLKRRYIVVASGCAAMDIATYSAEEGKSLYEIYPGDVDAGCLANVGSCVANSHIIGAAVKIPYLFGRRDLRANFEEIADYIYNRVGAVAVVWGAMTQKAFAIGNGVNRWGIPIVLGPQASKYRRFYLGRKDDPKKWVTYDAKTGEKHVVEPAPEHLAYVVESKGEAIVAIAKLCLRPNDTTKGRQLKLSHYVDLHERYFGRMPEDIHLFIRTKADIPITRKEEILKILEEKSWQERRIIDPTLVERLVKK